MYVCIYLKYALLHDGFKLDCYQIIINDDDHVKNTNELSKRNK